MQGGLLTLERVQIAQLRLSFDQLCTGLLTAGVKRGRLPKLVDYLPNPTATAATEAKPRDFMAWARSLMVTTTQ